MEEIDIEEIKENLFRKKRGLLSRIIGEFRKSNVFFIGDLHLDHANIIKYCNRPFNSVEEMNNTLINNWNNTIKKDDIVFFLGDMAFGRGSRKADYWINKLNGNIIFIRGNHDTAKNVKYFDKITLNLKGLKLLLIHNPVNIPDNWNSWCMHGHTHNKSPLIDRKNKRINVSVEALNYKPLPLRGLLELIQDEL